MAGLNHCEETEGRARGGGPPVLLKTLGPARSSPQPVSGFGVFFKGRSGERGPEGEMERLLLSPARLARPCTCAQTHTHTHELEPMGGEERSHIRAQPCLIMDLMETVSAQSVSTCAAPDSSQLLSFYFFMCIQYSHSYTIPPHTHTHTHLHA